MNNLLFDLAATQPNESYFHGGAEYTIHILRNALEMGYNFDVCYNFNKELYPEVEKLVYDYNLNRIHFDTVSDLNRIIAENKYKAFFSGLPYLYHDLKTEILDFHLTMHGLRSLEMTSIRERIPYVSSRSKRIKLTLRWLKRELLPKLRLNKTLHKSHLQKLMLLPNARIYTVSNHSKNSLISFFPFLREKDITVCYPPLDFNNYSNKNNLKLDFKYYLLVSSERWIKNNIRAIYALDQLMSDNHLNDTKVIVLGSNNVISNLKLENPQNFIFKKYVSREDLEVYFKNAYSFIYPTINEGFGYPPVIAFKYGVPTIVSAITSVPEVCKDASLYFNPFSIDEIKTRIIELEYTHGKKQELIENGFKRLQELKNLQEKHLANMIKQIFDKNI